MAKETESSSGGAPVPQKVATGKGRTTKAKVLVGRSTTGETFWRCGVGFAPQQETVITPARLREMQIIEVAKAKASARRVHDRALRVNRDAPAPDMDAVAKKAAESVVGRLTHEPRLAVHWAEREIPESQL